MLKHKIIFIFILLISVSGKAQRQFLLAPESAIDSLLNIAQKFKEKNDTIQTNLTVASIDKILDEMVIENPAYTGLIQLYQAFYSYDTNQRISYQNKALKLLKESNIILADLFALEFYNLMMLYYNAGRMDQWAPADSVFRGSVAANKTKEGYRYAILNYANKKLDKKEYEVSKNLASYDFYCLMHLNSKDPVDKLSLMYLDWLITKGDLEQWMAIPYVQKFPEEYTQSGQIYPVFTNVRDKNYYLRQMDFASIFKTLISRVKELNDEMVVQNKYGSEGYNAFPRSSYYTIYTAIMNGFYSWAAIEQKEGQVLLPLKEYLYRDIIPNEMDAAAKAKVKPAISASDLVSMFRNLCSLYEGIGDGAEAINVANDALELINEETFTIDESILGIVNMLGSRCSAYRTLGNYKMSLKNVAFLKKYAPLPVYASTENKIRWERYMGLHIEEVYTLLAMQKYEEAKDSLVKLIDNLSPLDSADVIYHTDNWPHLQYLTALFSARKGIWNTSLLDECMHDIENNPAALKIFYPLQLLYFKAIWYKEKKVSESLLANVLFYTGRQIRYTFMMLSAEDRMRLYEQKLSPYFDVYHELLFSKKLDGFPELKEKVIAQSLSIKNALADGNLISNELLLKPGKRITEDYIEKVRALRQETNMLLLRIGIDQKQTQETRLMRDQVQSLWLKILEQSGMDSLVQLTRWQTISSYLKPTQIYTETIRYNKWLSDSNANYGAYIISPGGKMDYISLYEERKLESVVNDPSASPQNSALGMNSNRGSSLIDEKEKPLNTYNPDSTDKLADVLLKPFLPYLTNNKEWFIVQDGLLNRISFAALKYKKKYLFQEIQLSLLTASNSLTQTGKNLPTKSSALLCGGLNYGTMEKENESRLFKNNFVWNYLPGTAKEITALEPIFRNSGCQVKKLTGHEFPDSMIKILEGYQLIHLATHGFYLDSAAANKKYELKWSRPALKREPLYRCGIVVSEANNPDTKRGKETEGYLLGYELSNIDLRKCFLITLSACETGLGDLRNNLGVDGLSRALKIAGAKYLLISLWKVPDQPTAVFMTKFYEYLFTGKNPEQALRATQTIMSKTYPVSDWAAFVLIN